MSNDRLLKSLRLYNFFKFIFVISILVFAYFGVHNLSNLHAGQNGCVVVYTDKATNPDDCEQPFGVIDDSINTLFSLTSGTTTVTKGKILKVKATSTQAELAFAVHDPDPNMSYRVFIFREENNVYEEVARDFANFGSYQDMYFDIPLSDINKYHAVINFEPRPILNYQETFPERIRQLILPVAHAVYFSYGQTTHIPFTFLIDKESDYKEDDEKEEEEGDEEDVSHGRSNVLFLPGVQASRLYVSEDVSTGWFSGYKAGDRVWEPNKTNDVFMLEMDTEGVSTYAVHTEQVIDRIMFDRLPYLSLPVGEVYESMGDFLSGLVAEGSINQWYPYAYDWRYNVEDVAKYGSIIASGQKQSLVDTVKALAVTSRTGKVTIVAHSNGGLLAKMLIEELRRIGREDVVDTLVMIAVPQIGTPKALASILHGYDQSHGWGLVTKKKDARKIMNNFPSIYSLLPAERYVQESHAPLITFDDSWQSDRYRIYYGESIEDFVHLKKFLLGTDVSESDRSLDGSIRVPVKVNENLLKRSIQQQAEVLSNWEAPAGMRVVEFVGVGLLTPESLQYESILRESCARTPRTIVCANNREPRPFLQFSLLGDETVMGGSAGAYRGKKELYYFNLKKISDSVPGKTFSHSNFTENIQTQHVLHNIIFGVYNFDLPKNVSVDLFDFTNDFTVKRIASPVDILVTDSEGNQTGVVGTEVVEDIPGSRYFEMAGVTYVTVPSEVERNVTLTGTATGTYNYYVDTIHINGSDNDLEIYQAGSTPDMMISYNVAQAGRDWVGIDWGEDYSSLEEELVFEEDKREVAEVSTSRITSGFKQGNATNATIQPMVAGISTEEDSLQYVREELYEALLILQEVLQAITLLYEKTDAR